MGARLGPARRGSDQAGHRQPADDHGRRHRVRPAAGPPLRRGPTRDYRRDRDRDLPGVRLGQKPIPLQATGAYVPGGRYPLLASAHMIIVPAKTAGVDRVVACTPPLRGATPAASIAAMALGTESVEQVAFIAGPGNAYVAEAKRQLFGEVGIVIVAGPTETLIVADDIADPFVVAVDLLSQAEHGPDSPAVLITTSERVGREAIAHADRLLPDMPTRAYAEPAWRNHGEVHLVGSMDAAYDLANEVASEHVQILTEQPRDALDRMQNYGAVFLGEQTTVSFGDKVIGTTTCCRPVAAPATQAVCGWGCTSRR